MVEKAYCDIKHNSLDEDVKEIKDTVKEHTRQISYLERNAENNSVQIKHLLEAIRNLVSWIRWGIGILITFTATMGVWLLQQQLRGVK